jgi:hypothetical protein
MTSTGISSRTIVAKQGLDSGRYRCCSPLTSTKRLLHSRFVVVLYGIVTAALDSGGVCSVSTLQSSGLVRCHSQHLLLCR